MKYNLDDFVALIDLVENEGGVYLSEESHTPEPYIFTDAAGRVRKDVPAVKGDNCGENALFDVPYYSINPGVEGEIRFARVCGIDDDMAKWPRYGGDRFAT